MEISKTKHEEEIGQLKEEISQTKKRQWVSRIRQGLGLGLGDGDQQDQARRGDWTAQGRDITD